MDLYNLNINPAGLTKGLEDLFGYMPTSYVLETKSRTENHRVVNADMELQPFEIMKIVKTNFQDAGNEPGSFPSIKKDDIILRIIPYTINDIHHNPRFVRTIEYKGISEDRLRMQLKELHELGYI